MATTTKKKFIEGIISNYGLEPGVADVVDVDDETETTSETTSSSRYESTNKQFVNAMVVMKKVREDGQPGIICTRGNSVSENRASSDCDCDCSGSEGGISSSNSDPRHLIRDDDFLCIGSVGSAYNRKALEDSGITHILCMADICKIMFPESFVYKRVTCRDTLDQDIFSVLEECFSFIHEFRHTRNTTGGEGGGGGCGRILIHCYQGVSRATTICAAYMIQFLGYSVDGALACIRQCRPQASPNYHFMKSLRILESRRDYIEDAADNTTDSGGGGV